MQQVRTPTRDAGKARANRWQKKRSPTTKPRAARLTLLEWAYRYLPEHFYGVPADFHREIAELLESESRAVFAAPRGHSKSSLITLAYTLYRLAYGLSRYVVVVSDSGPQATDHVGNIYKELLENEKLTRDFPHLALPGFEHYRSQKVKRTTADFITVGGVRVTGKGAGMALRGMRHGSQRPDLLILDDVENDESVRTADQREKLKSWFLKSASNLFGAVGGQLIVIGTVLHRSSLLAWLLSDEGPQSYSKRLYRAVKEDGTALWPDAWTLELLDKKRNEIGSRAFSSEYMNEPVDEGSTLWKEAWVTPYRVREAPECSRIVVAVDPSVSGTGDACGIVAAGKLGTDAYVLEDNTVQGSPATWARIAVDTYARLHADAIVAEKNQGGLMIEQTIRSVLRLDEPMPPVKLVWASKGKAVRAEPVATLYEQGVVHHVRGLEKLEDELLTWTPGMASPNRLDSVVYALSELMLEPETFNPPEPQNWY